MARKGELTPKQQRFVEEYLVDFNASAAARRAGYSEHTAPFIGAENLRKPLVASAIEKGRAEVAKKALIDADSWTAEVSALARDTSVQVSSRVRAYGLLGQRLGILTQITKHEGLGDIEAVLHEGRARLTKAGMTPVPDPPDGQ